MMNMRWGLDHDEHEVGVLMDHDEHEVGVLMDHDEQRWGIDGS